MRSRTSRKAFAVLAAAGIVLAACGSDDEASSDTTTPAETTPAESTPAETTPAETTPAESTPAETTPADGDPLAALHEECVAEGGKVNLIALPDEWANYKGILAAFGEKYPGVEYPVANPDASSADEMNAVETLAGQDDMPDNVDVSPAIAQEMVDKGLFEPYVLTQRRRDPRWPEGRRQQLDGCLLRHHGDHDEHHHRAQRTEELRRPEEARVRRPGEPER